MVGNNENVLIALPTFNEEEAIEGMLNRILKLGISTIVVDAGSVDKTVEIAKKYKVPVFDRKEYGSGYGCGILKAFDIANKNGFDWLIILDTDMTYPPEAIPDLISASDGADMVIGTRSMKDIDFWHRLANNIHRYFASFLFFRPIADLNSGMRMMRIEKFFGHLTEKNMGMIPQISAFAIRNEFIIREVPIKYYKRVGSSKADVVDGILILWCIFRERFRRKSGT